MFRPLLALAVALVPAVAHADSGNLELGPALAVASESSDVRSAGHPGVAVSGVAWNGSFGLVVEAGHQPWAWDSSANWLAAGARISPASSPKKICDRRSCLALRPWLELGVAREMWMIEEPGIPQTSFDRNAGRAGVGLDMLTNNVGGTVWFRVQHATDRPTVMGAFGEAREPYDTSLVVGLGVFFAAM
ncbi:MAG TPA: hypothetical protein VL326_01405 [Kofleriaceae bacterium]|jgi:hypothetical protein|nr:hypothetical protein [Kofleriaceae bacterium]